MKQVTIGVIDESSRSSVYYGDSVVPGLWSLSASALHWMLMSTAIYIAHTSEGFAIAADGRNSRTDETGVRIVGDTAQKIFPIQNADRALVYGLAGTVGITGIDTENVILDFVDEIQRSAEMLKNKKAADLLSYTQKLCGRTYNKLAKAHRQRQLRFSNNPPEESNISSEPGTTICRLFLAGYYHGKPSAVRVRFFHRDQELAPLEAVATNNLPQFGSGSLKVWNILRYSDDVRFSEYRTSAVLAEPHTLTLTQAIEVVRQYVSACCDPKSLEIDRRICEQIGGYIHVATITKAEGFKWIVPPVPGVPVK